MKNMKIDANGTEIRVMGDVVNEEAYIFLTDMVCDIIVTKSNCKSYI